MELREVYSGTAWQAGLLKSVLEDAGLVAFLDDFIMGTLNPWWTAGGGAGSVRVSVPEDQWDEAHKLVEEFEHQVGQARSDIEE